jgi:hypothetical protein
MQSGRFSGRLEKPPKMQIVPVFFLINRPKNKQGAISGVKG